MKKLFLTALMCVLTMSTFAQIKSLEVKGNLRGDFGLGVGITMPVMDKIDFAPNFNYYFTDGTVFTLDGDFHYNFDLNQEWTLYPLVGLAWFHASSEIGNDYNKLGVNLGGGARYNINSQWSAFVEAKYQWVNDFDDSFFSLGVSYKF